jgi:hypothetical protein
MPADLSLTALRADAWQRVPDPPGIDEVTEDAGRQRLAGYYLYSALLAGLIGDADLAPARWPPALAEPMQRLGLTRFAPRTGRGLDAELAPAEQVTRRSPDREFAFAQLLVDLINQGAFGPLCGDADRVRLAGRGEGRGRELELIKGHRVVATCPVQGHWELVAQHLAGAPLGGPPAETATAPGSERTVAHRVKDTGIAHAVSLGVTLAVTVHPVGVAAGLGTRLIQGRLHAGREQADALRQLGQKLAALRAQADGELDKAGGELPRHRP